MAYHRVAPPWSNANHALLARAVEDPVFMASVRATIYDEQRVLGWVKEGDVPKTFRIITLSLIDDWNHKRSSAFHGRAD
jgi:hypothetical protein